MYSHVDFQVVFLVEPFPTDLTFKGLLTGVHIQVAIQVTTATKSLVTVLASWTEVI